MNEKEARKKIKEAGGDWKVFMHWMRGQTCGFNEDGSTDFYDHDVSRFIRYKCNPENELPWEFD